MGDHVIGSWLRVIRFKTRTKAEAWVEKVADRDRFKYICRPMAAGDSVRYWIVKVYYKEGDPVFAGYLGRPLKGILEGTKQIQEETDE